MALFQLVFYSFLSGKVNFMSLISVMLGGHILNSLVMVFSNEKNMAFSQLDCANTY
jgi:hypothetical protein